MKHALLVEDLPDTGAWLVQLLSTAFPGIKVSLATSVAEGLAAAGGDFDLAIVDLGLPDGSGVTVIEALAQAGRGIAIVVATIYDDDEHLFPALQAGAQGYLLKDQPAELLARQLRGILDGNPPLSPAIARRLLGHFRLLPESRTDIEQTGLTAREQEVLGLIARGLRIPDIAADLGISHHTVSDHVKNIYRKLNISSRAQAATEAARLGLLR